MTADWARVPYAVLEQISTRITNEVRESTGSPSTSRRSPGHHRVGVSQWEGGRAHVSHGNRD